MLFPYNLWNWNLVIVILLGYCYGYAPPASAHWCPLRSLLFTTAEAHTGQAFCFSSVVMLWMYLGSSGIGYRSCSCIHIHNHMINVKTLLAASLLRIHRGCNIQDRRFGTWKLVEQYTMLHLCRPVHTRMAVHTRMSAAAAAMREAQCTVCNNMLLPCDTGLLMYSIIQCWQYLHGLFCDHTACVANIIYFTTSSTKACKS